MKQHFGTRRRPPRPSQFGRKWVVLCLMLSMWRGPLPWLHEHDDAAADRGGPQLAWHLQWLHPQSTLPRSSEGWHWHFVLPNDVDGDGRQDGDAGQHLCSAIPLNGDGRETADRDEQSRSVLTFGVMLSPSTDDVAKAFLAVRDRRTESPSGFRFGAQVRLLSSVVLC